MKKLISFLVLVCLLIGLAVPAYADALNEGENPASGTEESQDPAPDQTSPTVTTLEELQAAINALESGDTITIAQEISLTAQSLETDKNIIITRADGFTSPIFYMNSGSAINGFSFQENDSGSETISVGLFADGVSIKNCFFDNKVGHSRPYISIGGGTVNVKVDRCSFSRNNDSALDARANTFIKADNCTFKNNSAGMQGGAINSAGTISLNNCTITDNAATSGGGVFCSGELVVSGCQFGGNKITAENAGADIFCTGKLSINDEMVEAAGYYEMTTGEKIMLPLENLTSIAKLAYFTTAEAEDYFKPINPMPDPDPEPGEGDNSNEEPPIIPPVDNEDNQDSPQMPQQPSESGNDSSDGQSPAVPQTLIEAIVAPTAGLVCGDAVIDTSRSVVLEGYGDGFLHEDDPLTREQLATIIYRLLDEATIEKYGTDISPFADVDSSVWSVQYISTLAKAGIVAGIDNVNYAPSGLVTWAQALAVLSRFVEQQEIPVVNIQYDGWALKAIQTSVANHWIADSVDFNPDMLITRGDLVNVLNRILEQY